MRGYGTSRAGYWRHVIGSSHHPQMRRIASDAWLVVAYCNDFLGITLFWSTLETHLFTYFCDRTTIAPTDTNNMVDTDW